VGNSFYSSQSEGHNFLDEGMERNYILYISYFIEVSDYKEGKTIWVTSNIFNVFGTSASIYIIMHLQNSIKQHK